jgi:hypothetical protein
LHVIFTSEANHCNCSGVPCRQSPVTPSLRTKITEVWECKGQGEELYTRATGLAKWRKEYIKAKSHISQI